MAVAHLRAVGARIKRYLVGSRGPRRYLAPGIDFDQFFDILRERSVRYVVLRWFEELPQVRQGEDVDILVDDADLEFVHTLLRPRRYRRHSQKFDVYSVSGLPGSDYLGVPYFPPRFARRIVTDGQLLRERYRVPSPMHHFESMAYHAVYHKGCASGLRPTSQEARSERIDHDYEAVLTSLGASVGFAVTPTLDSLDRLLHERDLRPPADTLERLSQRNAWITDRHLADRPHLDPVWDGLAVFVVRARAVASLDQITSELEEQGFEILDVLHLNDAEGSAAAHHIRGGNWERGPFPVSGGQPACFVVGYDVAPRFGVEAGSVRRVNRRIQAAKVTARRHVLDGVGVDQAFNPLHSSDDAYQARDYLAVLDDPDVVPRLLTAARKLLEACAYPYPVVDTLGPDGPGRRARVAVVRHPDHGLSVCKVFRPGAARYFERELFARTAFGHLPVVPRLLEHGDNWLLTPLYRDTSVHVIRRIRWMRKVEQLRPEVARTLARFARDLHEQGYFLLDLTPHNLVSDPVHGLKVLDLEFLQRYVGPPPSDVLDSPSFGEIPASSARQYDRPRMKSISTGIANSVFHPANTGLSRRALLRGPRWYQPITAPVVRIAWLGCLIALGGLRRARRLARSIGAGWVHR